MNYEFGLARVLRSLKPLPAKLSVDTWHYAKRCIVALLDHMAKQMVALKVCWGGVWCAYGGGGI